MSALDYKPDEQFPRFLEQLRQQAPREWLWLMPRFRQRLIPWLRSRANQLPRKSVQDRQQFVEEVFEETLAKFIELLKEGSFENYSDLEATVVTVAGYKLKEGYARLKRENRYYLMETTDLNLLHGQKLEQSQAEEREKIRLIATVKTQLDKLDIDEQDLLLRYFNGEELRDIAADIDISAAACRKRKQRVLEKLRGFVFNALKLS